MTSLISPTPSGVILDTNVISLFAKINRLDLLLKLFAATRCDMQFYITPTIRDELTAGYQNKVHYLADALQLVNSGQVQLLRLTRADKLVLDSLPAKLGAGEAEAIALCHRLNFVFITHDQKAVNYCNRVGIVCIRLRSLLDRLKAARLLTEADVQKILE